MALPLENLSEADLLRTKNPKKFDQLLDELSNDQVIQLFYDWRFWGRPQQLLPPELLEGLKNVWLLLAGRGFGKTRAGAEGVRELVNTNNYERIALIGPTIADVRDVMIEGESGLLSIFPKQYRPVYNPSKRLVTFHNGATGHTYSADEPDRLRGPQHHAGWCDEICQWRYCQDAWDMYQFGLRLGEYPLSIVSTTPKPTKFLKELVDDKDTIISTGSTFDNKKNLAPAFLKRIQRKYEGTRLGRQELYAHILDDNPNSLFKRGDIERARVNKVPKLARIVVGMDPAVTNNINSDETGIIVAGIDYEGEGYVLQDPSLKDTPAKWAEMGVKVYDSHEADLIVGETNNGGDLIELAIRQAEKGMERPDKSRVAYKKVTATRGKVIRAEFLTLLYEQGRIHHVGAFPDLEDEMCDYDPTLPNQPSPNRLDALVWAFKELYSSDIHMPELRII